MLGPEGSSLQTASANCTCLLTISSRCPPDMYPHPLWFQSPVLSLQLEVQHPCLLGKHLLVPSLHPSLSLRARHCSTSSPSLSPRFSSMYSPRASPRFSLCLLLTPSPGGHQLLLPQFRLRLPLRLLSFLQWRPSLLPWRLSSALEPQVDLGHSQVKNWGHPRLPPPLPLAPLSPLAPPMCSRGRSPEFRRSSSQRPIQPKTKAR